MFEVHQFYWVLIDIMNMCLPKIRCFEANPQFIKYTKNSIYLKYIYLPILSVDIYLFQIKHDKLAMLVTEPYLANLLSTSLLDLLNVSTITTSACINFFAGVNLLI